MPTSGRTSSAKRRSKGRSNTCLPAASLCRRGTTSKIFGHRGRLVPVGETTRAVASTRAMLSRVDETAFVARNAEFASSGAVKAMKASRTRQAKQSQGEMASLDTQLVERRRARLRAFYREQEMRYQRELVDMGLSLKW
ncbi:hypothetical protein M885DRAFT_617961 [Pelagophyceae sp. CCMP2097]|nr:hypothetical protein M885DRAFT_617961 [Pelagophyceae sp. CCMP2097]